MAVVLKWEIKDGGVNFTVEAPTTEEAFAIYRELIKIDAEKARVSISGSIPAHTVRDIVMGARRPDTIPAHTVHDIAPRGYEMSAEGLAADGENIVDSAPWTAWHGGAAPGELRPNDTVQAQFRSGMQAVSRVCQFVWRHDGDSTDIISYRKVS